MGKVFLGSWVFGAMLAFCASADPCRLALVLALDVSGSVDEVEYRQQLDGLAFALDSPNVREAILQGAASVHIAAFEWSSRNHQFLVLPWTELTSHAAIDHAAKRIRRYQKQRAGLKTALSTAMMFAAEMLSQKPACWQRTIDVSGDGENNIGPLIEQVYGLETFQGVTVNALVVTKPQSQGSERSADAAAELRRYFERSVIRGPGAFAMVADGYADYARAMERKLLREVTMPQIGQMHLSNDPGVHR